MGEYLTFLSLVIYCSSKVFYHESYRSQAVWCAVDRCRVTNAQLMNTSSGPGRTWIVILERRLRPLATKASAGFLHARGWFACVPDMAGGAPEAGFANTKCQSATWRQLTPQRRLDHRLGHNFDSLCMI